MAGKFKALKRVIKKSEEGSDPSGKNKSIKGRLLSGIIAMCVAISILFGTFNGYLFYRDAKNNTDMRLKESAEAYSQAIENAIDIYKIKIEAIAQYTSITDRNKSDGQRKEAMDKLAKDYGFLEVTTADVNGKASNGADVSQLEYFSHAIKGETYISTTMQSKELGKTVLVIAAKVNNGEYNGIVTGTLDADVFSKMIDAVTMGKSGYGFVADKAGKVVAHKNRNVVSNETNYIELAKSDSSLRGVAANIQEMINGKSDIRTARFKGKTLVMGYTPITNTDGWSIGVAANQSEMMAGFYQSLIITIILAVLMILASLHMAFRIAGPIVRPIIGLAERIKALDEGDLHSEVPQINTGDELEDLSRSFTGTINTLNSYINEISTILSGLEKGDCTITATQDYKGDFVQIRDSLNGITYNLNSVFTKIKESSDRVAEGSRQISDASQALASGATEQAATVEELSASVSSVSNRAQQNAENVQKATGYVREAVTGMDEGNTYMEKLDHSMKEIGQASEKISNITKVIEDIAFQTNILALNAAVESARAGEAGKGFAVVADEVRNLAGKSAEAAKQTADLIGHSVQTVSEGVKIAYETTRILKSAAEKSGQVEHTIQEIAAASNEQVEAIDQINQGLTQVSTVVQTNAATAEESSASSEELDAQAQLLKQEVEKFRLQDTDPQEKEESVRYEAAATLEVPVDNTDTKVYNEPDQTYITPSVNIHDSAKY